MKDDQSPCFFCLGRQEYCKQLYSNSKHGPIILYLCFGTKRTMTNLGLYLAKNPRARRAYRGKQGSVISHKRADVKSDDQTKGGRALSYCVGTPKIFIKMCSTSDKKTILDSDETGVK